MVSGVVSEPAGGPVPGVKVQTGGKSATTDEAGRFAIADLSSFTGLVLSKEGYEGQSVPGGILSGDRVVNAWLPPTIRLAAGESNVMTFYPNDVKYDFPNLYEYCVSCKRIRITTPGRGILSFTMTADDPAQRLSVYAYEGGLQYCCSAQVSGALEFTGADEAVIYVSFLNGVPAGTEGRIEISTSFRSP